MIEYKIHSIEPEAGESEESLSLAAFGKETDALLGVLNFNFDGDFLVIEKLYVDEEYRRNGIGTALLQELVSTVRDERILPVEAYFARTEETSDLQGFFAGQPNFTLESGARVLRFLPERRNDSKLWSSCMAAAADCTPFFSLTNRTRNEFLMRTGQTLLPEVTYEEPLSLCVAKDGQIAAAILVERLSDTELLIESSRGERYDLLGVFGTLAKQIDTDYSDFDLLFLADEKKQSDWIKNLFLEKGTPEDLLIARWNGLTLD